MSLLLLFESNFDSKLNSIAYLDKLITHPVKYVCKHIPKLYAKWWNLHYKFDHMQITDTHFYGDQSIK